MTQVFTESGARIPVTVIDVRGNVVIQKKTSEGKDGYNAVKLGYDVAPVQEKSGMLRYRGANKPEAGVFLKVGIDAPRRFVREFRLTAEELDRCEVGQILKVEDQFNADQVVDVTGTSKGKGYSGVIKRHNFSMARATHGTHEHFRHGGSIGMSAWPARVFKGTKMPGQMGGRRVTIQTLRVAEDVAQAGVTLVQGAVPGANGCLVTIRPSIKKSRIRAQAQ
jgi:large subunit ribosomal protein L3